MIPPVEYTFDVKDTGLNAHLDRLPAQIRAKALPTIESLTKRLLNAVRDAEPMKTGRLRAATRYRIETGDQYIRGKVFIGPRAGDKRVHDVAAAALEYGVHSSFTVRSHDMRMSKILGDERFVIVHAYHRRVNISARRFLRGPFERMVPIMKEEITRAISGPIKL